MSDLFRLICCALVGLFRPCAALQAEILVLRHQLNVLRRRSPKRVALGNIDQLVFAGLYRLAPEVVDALKIIKPETVIRWHRSGLRANSAGGTTGSAHRRSRRPARKPTGMRHSAPRMSRP